MNDTYEPRRRWPWVMLLIAALLLLIVFGGHWVWSTGADRRLSRQVAAYKAAGEPIELDDFTVTGVADEDNAVIDLRAAARSINTGTEHFKAYDRLDVALPLNDKEIKAIADVMADNKAAFDSIDLAMTKKGIDWKIPFRSPAISILLPDLNQQHVLANLIAHHALFAHHQGDDAAALRDFACIFFLADAVGEQPVLISDLVATGMRSKGCARVQEIAPDLKIGASKGAAPPPLVKQLIAALLDERVANAGQHRALLGERASQLDTARCVADGRLNVSSISSGGGTATPAGTALGYVTSPIALGDGLIMIRQTTALMQAAGKSPTWPAFTAIAPSMPPEVVSSPYRHMLARVMMPGFDGAVQTHFRAAAERRMTAIALAVALYRADHGGRFPAKVEELVPAYLPSIPADPFASAAPIKYIAATQPILYSVGADGIDQAGNETNKNPNPSKNKWVMLDAVTHLTRQPRPPADETEPLSGVEAENLDLATTQPATAPEGNGGR